MTLLLGYMVHVSAHSALVLPYKAHLQSPISTSYRESLPSLNGSSFAALHFGVIGSLMLERFFFKF